MPEVVDTDVLVVGAGPAGLMAALCLTRLGINVKIVDRRLPGELAGQADGIQPRTLEVFESLGIGEDFRSRGLPVYRMVTYDPTPDKSGIQLTRQIPNVALPLTAARYSYELAIPIQEIEGSLRDALAKDNVQVLQPVVPTKLSVLAENQDGSSVQVTCLRLNAELLKKDKMSQPAREELSSGSPYVQDEITFRAKYVIGCDGARSWVRRQCGISMEGSSIGMSYGVIDFTPKTNFPTPRAKCIVQSPLVGPIGVIPKPNGTSRVYILLGPPAPLKEDGPDNEATAAIPDIVRRGFLPYQMELTDITWSSQYKVAQRLASKFSYKDRVFIAGDACHTHSPNAAQGANVSMLDVHNLAWKLAFVLRKWAKPSLLDTYEEERRPWSVSLIEFDKEIEKLFKPNEVSPEEWMKLMQQQVKFTTGIGLTYESSLGDAESRALAPGLPIGSRVPPVVVTHYDDWNPSNLHDILKYTLSFHLIVLPGDLTEAPAVTRFNGFMDAVDKAWHGPLQDRLKVLAIINGKKDTFVDEIRSWPSLPHRSIYLDESPAPDAQVGTLYRLASVPVHEGVAILVRPDGHIALNISMAEAGSISRVEKYLYAL